MGSVAEVHQGSGDESLAENTGKDRLFFVVLFYVVWGSFAYMIGVGRRKL